MDVDNIKVKPLSEYLNDRREMIEQIFLSIEQPTLNKMIPDSLKSHKLDDLKAECLVELLGMSRKRIIGVMEGKELDTSSSESLDLSDSADDSSCSESSKKTKQSYDVISKKKDKKLKGNSPHEKNASKKNKTGSLKKKQGKDNHDIKKSFVDPSKEINVTCSSKEANKEDVSLELEIPNIKDKGKNLLEILELEMRARAIRSLLRREEEKKKTLQEPIEIDEDDDEVIIIDNRIYGEIDLTKDDSEDEDNFKKISKKRSENSKEGSSKTTNREVLEEALRSLDESIAQYKGLTNLDSSITPVSIQTENTGLTDEIIVIDDSDSIQINDSSRQNCNKTWADRWLENKDIKRVVTTSKLLKSVKKKMINNLKTPTAKEKCIEKNEQVLEGSVEEYKQLSSFVNNKNIQTTPQNNEFKIDAGQQSTSNDDSTNSETLISYLPT